MPILNRQQVCRGVRRADGDRKEEHDMRGAKICDNGHAWCHECLEDNHDLTCDVCMELNCPDCIVRDGFGEPVRRFIECFDCLRRGVEDGGMQLCGTCYEEWDVYGCCLNALGQVCCPEHEHERVFCQCGIMICVDCLGIGRCACGDFQRALPVVVVPVEANDA